MPCINGAANFCYDLIPVGLNYCTNDDIGNKLIDKCLITNGTPGFIQFYDVEQELQIMNVNRLNIFVNISRFLL